MDSRISPTADDGSVDFSVDLSTGLVHVTVRPALGLESSRVSSPISVLDFLDKAAQITLEMNRVQRVVIAQMRNGQLPRPDAATGTPA